MAEGNPPGDLEVIDENEESDGSEEDEDTVEGKGKKKKKMEVEDVIPEQLKMEETVSLDLLDKNTSSFRCLAQVLMSSSSLMKQKMRFFPPLEDPGLDDALNFVPPDPVIDSTGSEKYRLVCKEHNIVPISRVLNSLGTEELNMKYYGLTVKQIEAISQALMLNSYVTRFILQDNWLTTEGARLVGDMLTENNTIEYLNLKECRIGAEGADLLSEGIMTNQCLRVIDLSFNNLGDEGIKRLQRGLIDNTSIQTVNLSHNYLGDGACEVLAKVLAENKYIEELDLSWNNIFSTQGLKTFSTGLRANTCLRSLNLAWNTITLRPAVKWIVRYMKKSTALEHLDLSNNRLAGGAIKMVRAGILNSPSLVSIKLGNNIITPDEAMSLLQVFVAKPKNPLNFMHLQNVFVNKDFIPIMRRLQARGKIIIIGGVLKNYEIHGPDINKLLFERARYLGMKPKKKKKKRDFGIFVLTLPDENVTKQQFQTIFKKNKMKMLDEDFRKELMSRFPYKKNKISLPDLKQDYLRRYPDTALPPKKKKKGKKGKKKKKKGAEEVTPAEEGVAVVPVDETKPAETEGAAVEQVGEPKPVEEALTEEINEVKPIDGETEVPPEQGDEAKTAEVANMEEIQVAVESTPEPPAEQEPNTEAENIVPEIVPIDAETPNAIE